MHEASITESIMHAAVHEIEQSGLTGRIKAVHVTAGVCQGLIPESMRMYYDMEKPGTPLADSELLVTVQPMVAHCPACDEDRELDVPVMFCPECGETMELIKGKEILITSIEVEDDSDSS